MRKVVDKNNFRWFNFDSARDFVYAHLEYMFLIFFYVLLMVDLYAC